VIVVAHGNSLRAIVKVLSNVSEKDITELNIPTSIPLIYEFDADFKVLGYRYLADPEELEQMINKVKKQTGSSK
jgi:2,3-bisphosphoglycerate-dependent phosphoglycerate mutase